MSARDELVRLMSRIEPVDRTVLDRVRARFDEKTKPPGSLGRLEAVAARLCAILRDDARRALRKAVVVFAADHGVAAEGVSAYPQEVTAQMLKNFAAGGAAINVLAKQAGAELVVVDIGVSGEPLELPGVRSLRVAPGTRNFAREAAMSEEQALEALQVGAKIASELADAGIEVIALGEMGIGNTTAASAVLAGLTGLDPGAATGRGTGVDGDGLARKVAVVRRALSLHGPLRADGLRALCAVGGLEIAGLAGVALGAASRRCVVLLDGFITGAAALIATRLCPAAGDYMIASHRSAESGHAHMLRALELTPLLDMQLRLGEGSGAALAMPLLDAALALLQDMATFESAGVSTGRASSSSA